MERETAVHNDAAVAALALRPDDRVLEIGYGPGRALEQLAAAVPRGFVAGIDHSPTMYETARRRCAAAIADGRVEVQTGDSRALPYPDAHFDKALAVHTLYFWRDPALHLREMYRVLNGQGVCVLGFRPREDPHAADFPETVYTFHARDSVRRMILDVGFDDVELTDPVAGFVLARASRQR